MSFIKILLIKQQLLTNKFNEKGVANIILRFSIKMEIFELKQEIINEINNAEKILQEHLKDGELVHDELPDFFEFEVKDILYRYEQLTGEPYEGDGMIRG